MKQLRIAMSDMEALRRNLLGRTNERCAILYAGRALRVGRDEHLLVREVELPGEEDYSANGVDHATLRPEFVARIAKRARATGMSLVFVHSHPGGEAPRFSVVDDDGELALSRFLAMRGQTCTHAAMVISSGGVRARELGRASELLVLSIGDRVTEESSPVEAPVTLDPRFDRQIRAFGAEGQQQIGRTRVAIVGLGGTGSVAAQQLVHLGIRHFTLVDADIVEATNLNRVVGASSLDVGRPKVDVAQRYLEQFDSNVSVNALYEDVVRTEVARQLVDADVIFCCTDSHGSRSVVQQVAYQYLIPCIDVGSTITTSTGLITGIFGRVQLLGPDQPCLWCSGLLDSAEVRRDLMSDFERKLDPYILGAREPAPSVISLNATVISLGVTMLLGLLTSAPIDGRHLIYNARTSTVRSVRSVAQSDCFICSRTGAFGHGDARPLFARLD